MDSVTLSSFRKDLSHMLDKVHDDHTTLLVTRKNGKPAIVMSLEDSRSFEETAYLMASPRNAARLNEAIAEIDAGRTIEHDLVEE